MEIRNTFFPLMIMRHWNRLFREAVDALSLELFKTQLGRDSEQLNLVKVVPAYSRDGLIFKGHFQPKPFSDCTVLFGYKQ